MPNLTLDHFLDTNRDEIIGRCRVKAAQRTAPSQTDAESDKGVPLFLQQLIEELRGREKTDELSQGAISLGRDLLLRGFTVGQVVHGYGDVCQSVTDLAVEKAAPISTEDFRTLNRCLDDAIADAVTEYARGQHAGSDGASQELGILAHTALTAFEAITSGRVGIKGDTAAALKLSLTAIAAVAARPLATHH